MTVRIEAPDLGALEPAPADVDLSEGAEGIEFSGTDLSGLDLSGLTVTECRLSGVGATDTTWRGLRFVDVGFEALTWPEFLAPRAVLSRVRLASSRIGALELYDAELDSVALTGCKVSWVNARGARLRNVEFRDCQIDELDLSGARADHVSFPGSSVAALRFDGAALEDVDLRGLDPAEISGIGSLSGATVSADQLLALAPSLAAHLGIAVADGD